MEQIPENKLLREKKTEKEPIAIILDNGFKVSRFFQKNKVQLQDLHVFLKEVFEDCAVPESLEEFAKCFFTGPNTDKYLMYYNEYGEDKSKVASIKFLEQKVEFRKEKCGDVLRDKSPYANEFVALNWWEFASELSDDIETLRLFAVALYGYIELRTMAMNNLIKVLYSTDKDANQILQEREILEGVKNKINTQGSALLEKILTKLEKLNKNSEKPNIAGLLGDDMNNFFNDL